MAEMKNENKGPDHRAAPQVPEGAPVLYCQWVSVAVSRVKDENENNGPEHHEQRPRVWRVRGYAAEI